MTTPDITTRLRESEDNRSTAQFFFEVGYSAAWADAYMANGKKAAFPISDESIERAWAIAPEAHDDPEEWERHMAATNPPPFQIVKASDHVIRSLDIRSPLNRAIYQAIRDFRMGNMWDEDGNGYPLVDLMSNPAPCDIGTGEEQMIALADEVCEAAEALSPWQPIETAPKDDWSAPILTCRMGELTEYFGNAPVAGYAEPPEAAYWNDSGECWTPIQRPHDVWDPTHWMPLPASPSQIGEG